MSQHPNSLKNLVPFVKGGDIPKSPGRPKGLVPVSLSLKRLLKTNLDNLPLEGELKMLVDKLGLKSVSEMMALKLVLLTFSQNPTASLSAIKEAMDRTEGQSTQNINITQTDDATELTTEQLEAIYEGRANFEDVLGTAESVSGPDASGKEGAK
jgi:hypothetical protein